MIGENIENIIINKTIEVLNYSKNVEMPDDIIETDNLTRLAMDANEITRRQFVIRGIVAPADKGTLVLQKKLPHLGHLLCSIIYLPWRTLLHYLLIRPYMQSSIDSRTIILDPPRLKELTDARELPVTILHVIVVLFLWMLRV
jgi:hypothetical protein